MFETHSLYIYTHFGPSPDLGFKFSLKSCDKLLTGFLRFGISRQGLELPQEFGWT